MELLIVDTDEIGEDQIKDAIHNARYSNRCISPSVKKITAKDIGEWSDDHPLNIRGESEEAYRLIFG